MKIWGAFLTVILAVSSLCTAEDLPFLTQDPFSIEQAMRVAYTAYFDRNGDGDVGRDRYVALVKAGKMSIAAAFKEISESPEARHTAEVRSAKTAIPLFYEIFLGRKEDPYIAIRLERVGKGTSTLKKELSDILWSDEARGKSVQFGDPRERERAKQLVMNAFNNPSGPTLRPEAWENTSNGLFMNRLLTLYSVLEEKRGLGNARTGVEAAYREILGRKDLQDPSIEKWIRSVEEGTQPLSRVLLSIYGSPEAEARRFDLLAETLDGGSPKAPVLLEVADMADTIHDVRKLIRSGTRLSEEWLQLRSFSKAAKALLGKPSPKQTTANLVMNALGKGLTVLDVFENIGGQMDCSTSKVVAQAHFRATLRDLGTSLRRAGQPVQLNTDGPTFNWLQLKTIYEHLDTDFLSGDPSLWKRARSFGQTVLPLVSLFLENDAAVQECWQATTYVQLFEELNAIQKKLNERMGDILTDNRKARLARAMGEAQCVLVFRCAPNAEELTVTYPMVIPTQGEDPEQLWKEMVGDIYQAHMIFRGGRPRLEGAAKPWNRCLGTQEHEKVRTACPSVQPVITRRFIEAGGSPILLPPPSNDLALQESMKYWLDQFGTPPPPLGAPLFPNGNHRFIGRRH